MIRWIVCVLLLLTPRGLSAQERPSTPVAIEAARVIAEYARRFELVPAGALVSRGQYIISCGTVSPCDRLVSSEEHPDGAVEAMRRAIGGDVADVRRTGACPPAGGTRECPSARQRPILAIGAGEASGDGWTFQVAVFTADPAGRYGVSMQDDLKILVLPRPDGPGWFVRSASRTVP